MDIFPQDLPGLTWSILRAPKFATRKQVSVSGRVLAVADYPYPIWTWTLTYDFLRDGNTTAFGGGFRGVGSDYHELYELMGFYLRQQGGFNVFLYDDPTDDSLSNHTIGVGDGSRTTFQLSRTLGAPSYPQLFTEPITQPNVITAVTVNGVPVGYSLGSYGQVTLNSAPPNGAPVAWIGTYRWPVRFTEDTIEFENFMHTLFSLKKLSFESVLLP